MHARGKNWTYTLSAVVENTSGNAVASASVDIPVEAARQDTGKPDIPDGGEDMEGKTMLTSVPVVDGYIIQCAEESRNMSESQPSIRTIEIHK